jgi:hypothetical protein
VKSGAEPDGYVWEESRRYSGRFEVFRKGRFGRKPVPLEPGQRADLNDTERTSVQSAFYRHGVANLQYPSRKTSYQRAQDSAATAFDAMPRPKHALGK